MTVRILMPDDTEVPGPWLVRKPGVTEQEFFALADEDSRWEFLDGEVIMHSPATMGHERLVSFLIHLVRQFAEQRDLGEVFGSALTVHLAFKRVVAPDVVFVSKNNPALAGPGAGWLEGAPDWACEVCSPSTRRYDLGEKLALYKEHGFGEVWIVDESKREITAVRLGPSGAYEQETLESGRVDSSAIEGLWIRAEWLWESPLPKVSACLREIEGGPAGGRIP